MFRWVGNAMRVAMCLVLASFLIGCSGENVSGPTSSTSIHPPPFHSTDITGASWGGDFDLLGHDGRRYGLSAFRGKTVILFFGYTYCPDVCPSALGRMAELMPMLGERAKEVKILFVTLDPERDDAAKLAAYVPWFHPGFLGLSGTTAEIERVAKNYRVFYARKITDSNHPDQYTLDHWAGAYVIDKKGDLRLVLQPERPLDQLKEDVLRLIEAAR